MVDNKREKLILLYFLVSENIFLIVLNAFYIFIEADIGFFQVIFMAATVFIGYKEREGKNKNALCLMIFLCFFGAVFLGITTSIQSFLIEYNQITKKADMVFTVEVIQEILIFCYVFMIILLITKAVLIGMVCNARHKSKNSMNHELLLAR